MALHVLLFKGYFHPLEKILKHSVYLFFIILEVCVHTLTWMRASNLELERLCTDKTQRLLQAGHKVQLQKCHFLQIFLCINSVLMCWYNILMVTDFFTSSWHWMLNGHWTQYKFVFWNLNCCSMTGLLLYKHGTSLFQVFGCPLLLPYSVQLQHSEDSDTFSACWVILMFPQSTKLWHGLQDLSIVSCPCLCHSHAFLKPCESYFML